MEQILTDIQQRLADQVPALKYIDQDWGQLDYYSPNPPVKWPCALVDIVQAQFTNTGGGGQLGMVQVKVRVGDLQLSPSSTKAPAAARAAALSIWEVLKDLHKALHGWAGHRHYSKLIRTAQQRIRREDGVRIYEITYTTQITDNSAVPVLPLATGIKPEILTP